jgi:hypothetical protein
MDARFNWAASLARPAVSALVALCLLPPAAKAAGYRTTNFTVDAPTPQLAKEIGDAAEQYRRTLAQEWLGRELPPWSKPCPIKAHVAPTLGAGGATSFVFDRGEVFGWRMEIQGSRERVLDSVVPHEVTHTIFATHFRQPLPRWADEGACTTVEHRSEIAKQERMLIDFLKTRRGIPFDVMFNMKEYPSDVLPLYAQGHSLARFLIARRGKHEFMAFLADGMKNEDWHQALRDHYEYEHLLALQNSWMDWIKAGRPEIQPSGNVLLASAQAPAPPAAPEERSSVAAAMGSLANGQVNSDGAAARPTPATPSPSQARAASVVAPESARTPRSVYGEKVTWSPASAKSLAVLQEAARPRDAAIR